MLHDNGAGVGVGGGVVRGVVGLEARIQGKHICKIGFMENLEIVYSQSCPTRILLFIHLLVSNALEY